MKWVMKFVLPLVLIGMMSCGDAEDDSILTQPPYSGITDSIDNDPDNADLYFERALRLSQNNKHDLAQHDYEKAYELNPTERYTLRYVSNLLLTERVEAAVEILEEGIKKYPENPEFKRILGDIYLQTYNTDKALSQYDSMLAQDSANFETWYDKGMLLLSQEDTTAALPAFEKAFQLMPINYTGHMLWQIYLARKDPRALEVSESLLANDSTRTLTDPLLWKGIYYSETGQQQKALEQFEEVIRRDWKMTQAHLEKGIVLYDMKQYKEALNTFKMAATVTNTDPDAYFWMGRCYESMGDREKAISNYQRAVSLEGSFREAKDALRRLER